MPALVRLITSCEGVATFANHEKCWYVSRLVIASDKTDDAADALMCIAWHGAVMMSSSTFSGTSNSGMKWNSWMIVPRNATHKPLCPLIRVTAQLGSCKASMVTTCSFRTPVLFASSNSSDAPTKIHRRVSLAVHAFLHAQTVAKLPPPFFPVGDSKPVHTRQPVFFKCCDMGGGAISIEDDFDAYRKLGNWDAKSNFDLILI